MWGKEIVCLYNPRRNKYKHVNDFQYLRYILVRIVRRILWLFTNEQPTIFVNYFSNKLSFIGDKLEVSEISLTKLTIQNILMWCGSRSRKFCCSSLERNICYYDMQNISSKNSLNKGPDVKIFCSNAQCQVVNEELTNLCQQVGDF